MRAKRFIWGRENKGKWKHPPPPHVLWMCAPQRWTQKDRRGMRKNAWKKIMYKRFHGQRLHHLSTVYPGRDKQMTCRKRVRVNSHVIETSEGREEIRSHVSLSLCLSHSVSLKVYPCLNDSVNSLSVSFAYLPPWPSHPAGQSGSCARWEVWWRGWRTLGRCSRCFGVAVR